MDVRLFILQKIHISLSMAPVGKSNNPFLKQKDRCCYISARPDQEDRGEDSAKESDQNRGLKRPLSDQPVYIRDIDIDCKDSVGLSILGTKRHRAGVVTAPLCILLKEGKVPYFNRNFYCYSPEVETVWDISSLADQGKIKGVLVSQQVPQDEGRFATHLDILAPMSFATVKQWKDTTPATRPQSYKEYKAKMAEECIRMACSVIPNLKDSILKTYTSTPLTYQFYTGAIQGTAYGINLLSVREWIKFAYKDTEGETLKERMRSNPAYHDIKSPSTIFTRQMTEDIPTGVIPIMELGNAAGVQTPLLESMVHICEALLNMDLHSNGRTLKNLGLEGKTKDEILNYINHDA